jgi:hypothetical protein
MAGPTPDTEREDSAWAEAIAGRSHAGMDPAARRQADLLRAGLQRRKAKLDAAIEAPNEANFQRLLFRLRKEGLDRPIEALPPHRRPFAWGIAASLMLATVIMIQQGVLMGDHGDDIFGELENDSKIFKALDSQSKIEINTDDLESTITMITGELNSRGISCRFKRINHSSAAFICPQTLDMLALIEHLKLIPPSHTGKIIIVVSQEMVKK